jgi:hypothetical protein
MPVSLLLLGEPTMPKVQDALPRTTVKSDFNCRLNPMIDVSSFPLAGPPPECERPEARASGRSGEIGLAGESAAEFHLAGRAGLCARAFWMPAGRTTRVRHTTVRIVTVFRMRFSSAEDTLNFAGSL